MLNGTIRGSREYFRYLNRVWRFFDTNLSSYNPNWREVLESADLEAAERNMRRKTHQTIQKITSDIDRFHFNTAVSALMEMMNELSGFRDKGFSADSASSTAVLSEAMEILALILGPFRSASGG